MKGVVRICVLLLRDSYDANPAPWLHSLGSFGQILVCNVSQKVCHYLIQLEGIREGK